MSLTNAIENDFIDFLFNETAMPSYGSTFYISLHTANPGETGSQDTSECAYGSYARVSVSRDSGGFTVSGSQASNTAAITFPACTSGSESVTYFGIGTSASGAGTLLCYGAIDTPLAVSTGITPEFAIGNLVGQFD